MTPPSDSKLRVGFIIDHPRRDLPGGIAFANALAARGCETVLIPMYDQGTDVPLLRLDALVVNCARPANLPLVEDYHASGLPVFVLDTEGGNQTEAGTNTPDRLATLLNERGYSDLLRGYFFWGPRLRDSFVTYSGMPTASLVATGCPRFDYASPRWRELLRGKEHDYVLVNANFPLVNPRFVAAADERNAALQAGWDAEYMTALIADLTQVFLTYLDTIRRLAEDLPDLTFVVRPHPFESEQPYVEAVGHLANVRVDGAGGVLPVIANSRCIVHLNCATAVESIMLDRLPVAMEFLNTDRLLSHAPLPSRISFRAQSYDELLDAVRNFDRAAAKFPFSKLYEEMIEPWFFRNDGLAADRMADDILGKVASRSAPVSLARSLRASRRRASLGQVAQSAAANLFGSDKISRLRARVQKARRDKLLDVAAIESQLRILSDHNGRPAAAVSRARHPLTGVHLASVACKPSKA